MNQIRLIGGSLGVVILFVLGSLSTVVGYQSVKSTVNDSPLFTVRTQRAVHQQRNILTAQYLGMGKGNLLQFPFKDNQSEQLKKVIDIIRKMDDKAFQRFTEICIQRIHLDKSFEDITSDSIEKSLHILKTNSVTISDSFTNRNNQILTAYGVITLCGVWFPGCVPLFILYMIVTTIVSVAKQIIFTVKDLCTDREKIQVMLEE